MILTVLFRWGDCTVFHKFTVFSELLNYMRCTLRVCLLHKRALAYTDLLGPYIFAQPQGGTPGEPRHMIICSFTHAMLGYLPYKYNAQMVRSKQSGG